MTLLRCRYACVWRRWEGAIFKSHSPDGCGREAMGDEDTLPETSCFLADSIQEVSVVQMWQQQQNLFHDPWRSYEYQQPHKRDSGGQGGDTLENNKHYLSVLVEHGSYLWIPLPKPHQSKSTALLSVGILVWFLFLKLFQHIGLWFWNPAILWQKALV